MQSYAAIKNLLALGYVLTGTSCLFGAKLQNIQEVNEGGVHKHFFHPYMQAFMMFVGEAVCIFVYLFIKRRNKELYEEREKVALIQGRQPAPKYLMIIPTICDLTATCFQYASLNFIPASVYQMLKGVGVISTFIFSYFMLKSQVKINEIFGCLFAVVGITLVGLSALLFTESSQYTTKDILIGFALQVSAMIIKGFQFTYEAKLLTKYYIHPLLMVGIEGAYGTALSWIVSVSATFIHCSFGPRACSYSPSGLPYIQRIDQFYFQLINSHLLIWMTIVTMLSIALHNLFGLAITKYVNALARSLTNLAQTALVWIIGLIVTATVGKNNPNYEWELLNWKDILMQAFGFILLISGTLIYNSDIKMEEWKMFKKGDHQALEEERQTPTDG